MTTTGGMALPRLVSTGFVVRRARDVDLTAPGVVRCIAALPLAYRLIALAEVLWAAVSASGPARPVPSALWITATLVLLADSAMVTWVLRRPAAVPFVDLAQAVVLNLVAAALAPPGWQTQVIAVSWVYLIGTVALFTLLRGVVSGIQAVVAGALLEVVMAGLSETGPPTPGYLLAGALSLLVPLVAAVAVLALAGPAIRSSREGHRQRCLEQEQRRNRREMHDTVLQVLESLALTSAGDTVEPAVRLAEVRAKARQQAALLRRRLDDVGEGSPLGLCARLGSLVSEMSGNGLRAHFVASDVADDLVSPAAADALCGAAGEALCNTLKHSGTTEAVLRLTEADGGITVIARDHGRGFDPVARRRGFGIENSILGRLAEVGGRADITSSPGKGTRVTLWVPER